MFQSKIRDIVIPQYEHARLAGLLAALWGNADFDRPAIDSDSFIKGVTWHDRGYGVIDNNAIGSGSTPQWLAIQQRGIELRYEDPAADILALLHVRRLLAGEDTPERLTLGEQADARIAERMGETPNSAEQFRWADRLTWFCDMASFDFCFEQPNERQRSVYARVDDFDSSVEINLRLEPGGVIRMDPWPLSVDRYTGFITGYAAAGYPDTLEPVMVHFEITPGES
jgi:hypothetical protein